VRGRQAPVIAELQAAGATSCGPIAATFRNEPQIIDLTPRISLRARAVGPPGDRTAMKDMTAHLEKLRVDAAECRLISDLATDPQKRELSARLAEHLGVLASEVERAIAARNRQDIDPLGNAWRLNAFWYPDQTGDQPAHMPRYFFNVRAEQSSVDDEGEELPDGHAAGREATMDVRRNDPGRRWQAQARTGLGA
jgi:Domain of unknown function (DUF6894)